MQDDLIRAIYIKLFETDQLMLRLIYYIKEDENLLEKDSHEHYFFLIKELVSNVKDNFIEIDARTGVL